MHGAEQRRHAIARRRYWWKKYQNRIDISRLAFIDETWTKTNMAPLRGWGAKGLRLQAYVPHGHWKTMTFVAALRCDAITAPCVFNGVNAGVKLGHGAVQKSTTWPMGKGAGRRDSGQSAAPTRGRG